MERGGALAEQARGLDVRAEALGEEGGQLRIERIQGRDFDFRDRTRFLGKRADALVVSAEAFEGEFPGVFAVRGEPSQNADSACGRRCGRQGKRCRPCRFRRRNRGRAFRAS
jgi:hypothetical protein